MEIFYYANFWNSINTMRGKFIGVCQLANTLKYIFDTDKLNTFGVITKFNEKLYSSFCL